MAKRRVAKEVLQALPSPLTPSQQISRMLRVNQAGEHGAVRIYQGQLKALEDSECAETLAHMHEQEQVHYDYFNQAIVRQRSRPSLLSPLWHGLGYALGFSCGALGIKAAMACTVAVEEVIAEHYQEQINQLANMPEHAELCAKIKQFRAEELEHHDIGIGHNALDLEIHPIFTAAVKAGSRLAIWLASRV